jgi:adenosylcobinamide amidohydrolase
MSEMKASTLEEHMRLTAIEIGLDPETSTGMCTAAQMNNVAIKEMEYGGVTVTAIVTGGIEINGARAGDPASWYEKDGKIESINLVSGTINIMLVIDAFLTDNVLAYALMTATEAKVAAIQELLLPSKYSSGIATGSGTDKVIIIGNPASENRLTDAGKHSKLGEMIAKTVICAVKEALDKQTEANPKTQHSVLKRMQRYGVTKEGIHRSLNRIRKDGNSTYAYWNEQIEKADSQTEFVVIASLYAHLLDQLEWGLLEEYEVTKACRKLLSDIYSCDEINSGNSYFIEEKNSPNIVEHLVRDFENAVAACIYSMSI